MAKMTNRDTLAQLTQTLLGAQTPPGDQVAAAWALHDQLTDLVALTPMGDTERSGADFDPTHTSAGVAIAPYEAAMCLREHLRTRQFGLGLKHAIQRAQEQFPDERLRILYAGTGPFATLATLQLPFFAADELAFTFLDIHQTSTDATQRLYQSLGAQDYVERWVTADASTFVPDGTYHIIVAEVLQRGLTREPQVQVTRHLARYLKEGGSFVPEEITLDLAICDPRPIFMPAKDGELMQTVNEERLQLGRVFTLTAESAVAMETVDGQVPLGTIIVPEIPHPDMTMHIFTRVRTHGDLWLNEKDCSLNLVVPVDLFPTAKSGERLNVSYRIGDQPGLVVDRGQPMTAAAPSATENQTTEMKARI